MNQDNDKPRLIEVAFPLKQTSLDSMHEKYMRNGHLSTLHIWPARRPLAACRAALIATLLPDPGNEEERHKLLEKLAGKVVKKVLKDGSIKEETEGGILHWGQESGPDIEWFRQEIRKAYGGRAPRVLDPFAGGGAIPLEAMRLGCEVTAIDINPVAWFILKCTLEYPQKLAGQTLPLPEFAVKDPEFMEVFAKQAGGGKKGRKKSSPHPSPVQMQLLSPVPDANLAWHVRAWGMWVLKQVRRELAQFYPTYADYQPLRGTLKHDARPPRLVPFDAEGNPDIAPLNMDYGEAYLKHPDNPRWVAKPTVAYLWARTVKCKNCRAVVPLLKTRWLCKKDKKRIVLDMKPNADRTGVGFEVNVNPPAASGNKAQQTALDKKLGAGTMSRSGAQCPCCDAIMTMEDIRVEGKAGRLGTVMTAVVVDGPGSKEYRTPQPEEIAKAGDAAERLSEVYEKCPFGLPTEPLPRKEALGFRVPLYGFDQWNKIFTARQLLVLGVVLNITRESVSHISANGYPSDWSEAIGAYLSDALAKIADRGSSICTWTVGWDKIRNTFARFALPITWDFVESVIVEDSTGGYRGALEWIQKYIEHALTCSESSPSPRVISQSAKTLLTNDSCTGRLDVILTDPPYYDAIPYSDLMDFFYVWHRRTLHGLSPAFDEAFASPLSPKWDESANDGELIDDSSRHSGDKQKSKEVYEKGMEDVFRNCHSALNEHGRLVVVFAHKHPDAWEALVSAIIRSGFVVDGSWPIQTEMSGRTRAISAGALSSSVWLVCKKRPVSARPGWDGPVLEEMRKRITERLRYFWDAGIRGPDFVWAATGPALEAYSKHPVVRKADEPGATMAVSEFLRHVRRMVVDFAVGRILSQGEGGEESVTGLDDVTIYYLLHRNDFGMNEAPGGACIMYALSCGLSDKMLSDQFDILQMKESHGGGGELFEEGEDGDETEDADTDAGDISSGGKVRLVPWNRRTKKTMGLSAPGGRPVPLIDQVHRMMHLWKAGDVAKVNEYLDERALRNNKLFHQLLQALIELAERGSQERSLLESISNHVRARGEKVDYETVGSTEVYDTTP
jgi:adenine-specific DNA methylase